MTMDKLLGSQSIIITLDVDSALFDNLKYIAQAGFSVVEVNDIEPSLLSSIIHHFPMLRIGAGNIVTTQQLEDCYQANAHFTTSPGFLPALTQTAAVYSMNYLPGVATLSEAMQAMSLGCHTVRPYPANLLLCTLLNKYLPLLRLFPAEIEWDEVDHYLNLPAVAAVSIINPDIKQLQAFNAEILV